MHVSLAVHWFNRNVVGTHFGGSLYAMVDPHLMLMLMQLLGGEYWVWDQSASIGFVKATAKRVSAKVAITDNQLDAIRQHTENGNKYFPEFEIRIEDSDGDVVAVVTKKLYVRKKRLKKDT